MVDLLAQATTFRVPAARRVAFEAVVGATATGQLFTRSQPWRLTIEGEQFTLKAGDQTYTGRILLPDKLEIEAGAFCATVRLLLGVKVDEAEDRNRCIIDSGTENLTVSSGSVPRVQRAWKQSVKRRP